VEALLVLPVQVAAVQVRRVAALAVMVEVLAVRAIHHLLPAHQ
jgi:hypothetical protein